MIAVSGKHPQNACVNTGTLTQMPTHMRVRIQTHTYLHTIIISLPCSSNLRIISPPWVQPNLNSTDPSLSFNIEMEPLADLCKLLTWFQRFGRLSYQYLTEKHCQCVVRISCVGMKRKWMPVWSCLDNLARLQKWNPQSHLNIETLKAPSLSRSWLSG